MLYKKPLADILIRTIEIWPNHKCIERLICLDCTAASATLLDLAITTKVVHDNSNQYCLSKRQTFWYSDNDRCHLEKNFPAIKVQRRTNSVEKYHSRHAKTEIYDELSGEFKKIPIYSQRIDIINKMHKTFETSKLRIYSLVYLLNDDIPLSLLQISEAAQVFEQSVLEGQALQKRSVT
ncbi:hypothetical protein BYT27DRAFT_6510278 [Phlegmacium glaucopus]|nr:hypothetical protein BYT27DRAFT_6510278 [Phlegmacium glaucopus]